MNVKEMTDKEYNSTLNSFMLDDDYRLLKTFPVLIEHKKDITFTAQIVDHFIDNFQFTDNDFLSYIPYSAYSYEQKKKVLINAMSNSDASIYAIPHLSEICNDHFDLALIIFSATYNSYFNFETMTDAQHKKLKRVVLKKINKTNFEKRHSRIPKEIIDIWMHHYKNDVEAIRLQGAKNFLEATMYTSLYDDNKEELLEVYDIFYKKFDSFKILIADNYHRRTMDDYIKFLIADGRKQELVDGIIKEWAIDKSKFKKVNSDYQFGSSGLKLLQSIVYETGHITTEMYGKKISYYRAGVISYHVKAIFEILKNVNNFNGYIDSVYKKSEIYK